MAVRIEDLGFDADLHASEAGARLGFAIFQGARAIHEDVRVMHIPLVAGTNLNRFDPARLLNGNGENEVPVGIGALRRQSERLRSCEDEIGLAESPALHKFGWR